ncbi:MAG: hypothetical protein HY220_00800 [Candidatus Sungbacteria bacterium]|uniref:Uncharacterized protein n=1 Tax=Candidatus Sungiibacteriota bacterium TaxID=2750080 RepID=A0A9D6QTL2_9BACT|nr:hypothetical protein [Candidatus Sungbacteria bacterium]
MAFLPTLKKASIVGLVIVVAWFLAGIGPALAVTTPPAPNFAKLQQTELNSLNAAIKKLTNAENQVSANPKIPAATKTQIVNSLNVVINGLNKYKTQVAAATSIQDLEAINQQIAAYIKANKDVIKTNVRKAIATIAANAAGKAQQFEKQIEALLKILALTCPSEKSTITALEQQITQFNTDIAALDTAIKTKNYSAMKQDTKDLQVLMASMLKNAKEIQAVCLSS